MALDLNVDVDDELDKYTWSWLTIGDDRVCPECEAFGRMKPATYTEWITERSEPGRGDTSCGDRCRCVMVPEDILVLGTDLAASIKLSDPKLVISKNDTYAMFDELDDLIAKYKRVTAGDALPGEFYDIETVQGRIAYLRHILKAPTAIPARPLVIPSAFVIQGIGKVPDGKVAKINRK
jgi:hypothetical protein